MDCDTTTPTVEWFKGDEKVSDSEKQEFKGGLCQLKFAHTTLSDGGVYRCQLTTAEGTVQCSATLKIKGGLGGLEWVLIGCVGVCWVFVIVII